MHHFRQSVRYATGADIVYRQNRIGIRQRAATVDHFLRTALNLGIAALHRIEVEVFLICTGVHTRRSAPAQPDQHPRAAQLHQQRTGGGFFLERVACRDVAHATGDHDRLVITAHFACDVLLVGTKVTREIRPAKFVVKRRATDRAFEHDLQR